MRINTDILLPVFVKLLNSMTKKLKLLNSKKKLMYSLYYINV